VKSEEELRKELYTALQGFFDLHPEYRRCPLYIAGESYAGKYVPHIATEIMNNNPNADDPKFINLKGIAVGDGWMKPKLQQKLQIDYAYNMGLVDTNQKARLDALYVKFEKTVDADKMKEAFELGSEIEELILNCAGNPDIYDVRRRSDDSDDLLRSYFNSDAVKEALNVSTLIDWQCADDVGPVCENLIEDNMKDVTYLLPDLIKNYRVLLYTGTFDMSCGFLGTELILQQVAPYEAWPKQIRKVWVNPLGKTMGYIKSYGNLTQATIPYAGHMVPQDNPVAARNMIIDWVFERTPMLYTPEIDEKRE
jgi:vitellogenic carboxypeptidase-like protein